MKPEPRYWLMKSEPESYSIDQLKQDKKTSWTGVRNYQARNFIREMRKGDVVFFYHSSCAVPGIYGLATVASLVYPDPIQFDPKDYHYEPRATEAKPLWDAIDITFKKKLSEPVTIAQMRDNDALHNFAILRKGSRLSVTPVTSSEAAVFLKRE